MSELEFFGTEKLRFDPSTPAGLCAICRMEPSGKSLDLTLEEHPGHGDMGTGLGVYGTDPDSSEGLVVEIRITICRDCLAEHAPHALAHIEAA